MITAGPFSGLKGLLTRYDVTVTARSKGGSEVRLRRGLQTVAVPVFQFGVFSDTDLTFFGGDDFDFGGRVHTNGNLWLSESGAGDAAVHRPDHRLRRRPPAVPVERPRSVHQRHERARQHSHGDRQPQLRADAAATARTKAVSPIIAAASGRGTDDAAAVTYCAALTPRKDRPVLECPTAPHQHRTVHRRCRRGRPSRRRPTPAISCNRHTGATVLRLPLVSQGAQPIDLIRRPARANTPPIRAAHQRYFNLGYDATGVQPWPACASCSPTGRRTSPTSPTVTATAPVCSMATGRLRRRPPAGYTVDAHSRADRALDWRGHRRPTGTGTRTRTHTAQDHSVRSLSTSGTAIDPQFLAPATMSVTSSTWDRRASPIARLAPPPHSPAARWAAWPLPPATGTLSALLPSA